MSRSLLPLSSEAHGLKLVSVERFVLACYSARTRTKQARTNQPVRPRRRSLRGLTGRVVLACAGARVYVYTYVYVRVHIHMRAPSSEVYIDILYPHIVS